MDAPRAPASLTAAAWQRQAATFAAARPAAVDQKLADFERADRALDLTPYDAGAVRTLADGRRLMAELEGATAAAVRRVRDAARALEQALARWQEQHRREARAREAMNAAASMQREAAAYRTTVEDAAAQAHEALAQRLQALQAPPAPAPAAPPPETPERRRVRARIVDQFRIVKNRPDREVHYLLGIGRTKASAWLHPTRVSDSQKPLLIKTMQGDTGFKWFRGRCIWEDGAYTFVGPRMNALMARRITAGLLQLTRVRYRIKAHEQQTAP